MKIKTVCLLFLTVATAYIVGHCEDIRGKLRFTDGTTSGAPTVLNVPSGSLTSNGGGTFTLDTSGVGDITGVTAGTGLTGGGTSGTVTLTSVVSTYSVTASGTAYQLTASSATLDFGTTDPTLTLTQAGTYLIIPQVMMRYNAASFASVRTLTLKLRRTNNTAADIVSTTAETQIITTLTFTMGKYVLPVQIYTTTNSDDALAITGFISVVPTAGSLDATEASITAVRLF